MQPKPPIGQITVTVDVYSEYDLDLGEVRTAVLAQLDGMSFDIDCDDSPDGVAVATTEEPTITGGS